MGLSMEKARSGRCARLCRYAPQEDRGLRAGINAQLLYLSGSYRAAGINKYIYQLLAHLRLLARGEDSFTVFTGKWELPPELRPTPHLKYVQTRLPTWRPAVRIAWEQLFQPVQVARERLDLLHSTSYAQPLVTRVRSVVTMLDLSFVRMPGSFNRWNRTYLAAMSALTARRCDRIIAISESTRRDIVHFLKVPSSKVEVIYCGVDDQFRPLEDRAEVERFRAAKGLPDRFLLYLGTLEPRKNVERLVDAYALLRRDGITSHKLVLAGAKGWLYDRIFARVRELGLMEHVQFASYVPYPELPLWYNAADIFIYPSLYEGFGLPPLEAMACGTPVVTSSVSSLPEVVGAAAVTVDPLDTGALAAAIAEVLSQPSLRERLRTEGPRQAARFSWADMARETYATYNAVLTG